MDEYVLTKDDCGEDNAQNLNPKGEWEYNLLETRAFDSIPPLYFYHQVTKKVKNYKAAININQLESVTFQSWKTQQGLNTHISMLGFLVSVFGVCVCVCFGVCKLGK